MLKDGNGTTYDAATAKFTNTPFGKVLPSGKTAAADLKDTRPFTLYNYSTATTFKNKVDNSVAGEMRDCAECHVGGGMMEYLIDENKTGEPGTVGVYDPAKRTSLRDFNFSPGGNLLYTAYNALIDIFNPAKDVDGKYTNRGDVVTQNYAETGVLEMDCLICHQSGYDWSKRKEAVREGHFDASRALGANLATRALNGVTVFYNSTSVTVNAQGKLAVDLSAKLNAKPASTQCNSCHQGTAEVKYQVEWKKRGEMWTYLDENGNKVDGDVHASIGCMACHERKDKSASSIGTNGLPGLAKATETEPAVKLSLCDPAKGGASPYEAMWNQLDDKQFKNCSGCHEPVSTAGTAEDPLNYDTDGAPYLTYETYGAPESRAAHTRLGLNSKIAYDKDGALVSHIQLIDCTACHIKKDGFTGGAFVDGTGADEEGRVALHDTENVARDMKDAAGLNWLGGKLHSSMYLTSFFWRDMNGLKTANGGMDANNDGREAGMDALLPTHVNNINIANGVHALTEKGSINATDISDRQTMLTAGIRAQLGNVTTQATNAFIPKLSFLLVPFKTSHNVAGADKAWGVKGCKECHSAPGTVIAAGDADNRSGAEYTAGGFYNGTYPINGNLNGKFSFNSNQVAPYTKVNGLVDATDSHPFVVTKIGDRSVPVKVLSMFDTPYTQSVSTGQTLRNIDRSEVLYEETFQTRNADWIGATGITGGVIAPACDSASPFYCETSGPIINPAVKKGATSTIGWILKVEIKDDVTSAVTTRTKQISEDKLISVDGIITALGAPFTNNDDFTVTAVIAGTGTTTVNNALKLTPKSGRTIRISNQSDVGPFGLKGKLWKETPIERPGVAGSPFAGREAWLTYLNSITKASDESKVTLPTSGFSMTVAVTTTPSAGATSVVGVAKDQPMTISGVQAGMTYQWRVNTTYDTNALHGEDEVPPRVVNARISNPTASNPTITFFKSGLWRITLTVTNRDGKVSVQTQRVNVTVPNLITQGTVSSISVTGLTTLAGVTTTRTVITTKVPVSLGAAGGSYTKVKYVWNDGSASTIVTTNNITDQTHVYNLLDKFRNFTYNATTGAYTYTGTVYNYTTTVQFWDNLRLIATKSIPVSINTVNSYPDHF